MVYFSKRSCRSGVAGMADRWILETDRLRLRELTQADLPDLCEILQDPVAMVAYAHAFSDGEAQAWLNNQRRRYREDGFGLWAVIRKDTGDFVGQAGLTWQDTDRTRVVEVGYLLKRAWWHRGYATEAAVGCRRLAFRTLDCAAVYSIIRDTNEASKRVARRAGMRPVGRMTKHYYGIDMPHEIFRITREEAAATDRCPVAENRP